MPPSIKEALAEEIKEPEIQGYEFKTVNIADPRCFPNFKSKEAQEKLF